jgi:hypothetical protein
MSKKTKAEKIARSLRAMRDQQENASHPHVTSHNEVPVFYAADAMKTGAVTLFIIALIILLYVLQVRGYIG